MVVVAASVLAAALMHVALPREMGELGCRALAVFVATHFAKEAIPRFAACLQAAPHIG